MTAPAPSAIAPADPTREPRLTLQGVLDDLVADGLATREVADKLLADRRFTRAVQHPLVTIAEQKWRDPRNTRQVLHVELLTEWFAGKVGLPYVHIDPFKIDFAAVTKLMSNAYATRYRILPIEVNAREATNAVCEPHVREWETELRKILRLDLKRVLANPLDIESFIVEFYNLARSVKGATEKDKGAYSEISNFEQLVQLGRSGKLEANEQHIVHICDWLFNYAFEQRANDIHIEPRRDSVNVRFRIDGVLHSVYQIPTPVTVHFCRESRLSGIGRREFVTNVWYRRTFEKPAGWKSRRTRLHIGACDWRTRAWVNGIEIGSHVGGSAAMAFDITDALREGANTVVIHAFDDTRSGKQALGKQSERHLGEFTAEVVAVVQDAEDLAVVLGGERRGQTEVSRLKQRLDDPSLHARDVSGILPDAVVLRSGQDGKLATALVPTVEEILKASVKRDPQTLVNALFPVMGPAIRKAIFETVKQMIQSFDQIIGRSFSWQGLKWRVEAFRTGNSFGEVALRHNSLI